jgi:hypothetical protein
MHFSRFQPNSRGIRVAFSEGGFEQSVHTFDKERRGPMRSIKVLTRIGAAVALALATGSVIYAGAVAAVSVSPNALTIDQSASGTFSVSLDSMSGSVPPRASNPPQLTYCTEWTIHNDGTITCDQQGQFLLDKGRNYTQNPPSPGEYAGTVTVNVDSNVPCGSVYDIQETVTSNAGSGVDFGSGVLSITRIVRITVSCPLPAAYGGCSHGYWKSHSTWPAPYTPLTTLTSVFTIDGQYSGFTDNTLQDALGFKGGSDLSAKARILMIQAVAALLNATQSEIFYELSTQEVINDVNAALASHSPTTILDLATQLESYNHGSAFCGE